MTVAGKNIKIILNYVIGPMLFCLLLYSIYRQIQRQPNWQQSLQQIIQAFDTAAAWKLAAVMGLMLLNWGLEARKWQVIINRLQQLSWLQCLQATFTGTTLAFFTPNRMGEYMGRVLYIEEGKRIQAISLTIVGSMGQLLITLVFGISGLIYFRSELLEKPETTGSAVFWLNAVLYASVIAACFLTLLYFRLSWLIRWIEKIPRIEKFIRHISVLDNFNTTMLWKILSISAGRYLVFVIQYYLLFDVFRVELNGWQVFWSVSVVFLVLAIVPTIALITELGVRWRTSVEVVQLFSVNVVGILAASLAIWIINLVIPALIGSLLILRIRIFNNREEKKRVANTFEADFLNKQ